MCIVLSSFIFFRATALAILSAKDGLKALKTSLTPQPLLSDRKLSPLQLLIKEMPGENLHSFPCQYSDSHYSGTRNAASECTCDLDRIETVSCCVKVWFSLYRNIILYSPFIHRPCRVCDE